MGGGGEEEGWWGRVFGGCFFFGGCFLVGGEEGGKGVFFGEEGVSQLSFLQLGSCCWTSERSDSSDCLTTSRR